ncbi:hypothetical protein DFH07DRAFT_62359 [Mycena maculata]|uniref:F-box domain-containing protein n=1 Tax=Mycena maculata TaxID=230809 RepID=A0AAD7N0W9_9AGAR|nr:hypothetical protein DFH07DRAFT_62359 [Mycena maculata]
MTQLCSPIQTAPTELLTEIFKLAMPTRAELKALGKVSLDTAPWVFGRVCARWRTIALDMPTLWTSIILAIPYGTAANIARSFPPALVREHLARSRTLPLDVLFTSKEEFPALTTEKVFAVIATAAARWEALEIESRQPLAFDQLRWNLKRLRRLCLCPSGLDRIPPPPCVRERDSTGALLWRDVDIGAFIPWTQLVEYTTTSDELANVDRLREAAASLVSCQFSVDILWTQRTPAVTEFSRLRKLTLTIRSTSFTSPPFLYSLSLPALEELYVEELGLGGLRPLLRRSGCSLKKLWFYGLLPRDDFVWIAENNPHIAELGMVQAGAGSGIDRIMNNLRVAAADAEPLLPALRALHILGTEPYFQSIFEMLESRMERGAPLQVLSMHLPREPKPRYAAMTARLKPLKDGGLEVQAMKKLPGGYDLVHFL